MDCLLEEKGVWDIMLETKCLTLYKSRVQRPCSFDMLHHLARRLFQGLNGQINHLTDCGQEMNGCGTIGLRPNLSAIGQQKPGAAQLPRRLFRLRLHVCLCASANFTLLEVRRNHGCAYGRSRRCFHQDKDGAFLEPVFSLLHYTLEGFSWLWNILWFNIDSAPIIMVTYWRYQTHSGG